MRYGDEVKNVSIYRTTNDVNGNPRWVVHYLSVAKSGEDFHDTLYRLKNTPGIVSVSRYRGKDFGGGIVFQSYNVKDDVRNMLSALDSPGPNL